MIAIVIFSNDAKSFLYPFQKCKASFFLVVQLDVLMKYYHCGLYHTCKTCHKSRKDENRLKAPKPHFVLRHWCSHCSCLPCVLSQWSPCTVLLFFLKRYSKFSFLICSVCILPYLWQQHGFSDSHKPILLARGLLFGGKTGCKTFKQTRGIMAIYVSQFGAFQDEVCRHSRAWYFKLLCKYEVTKLISLEDELRSLYLGEIWHNLRQLQ